MEGRRLLTQHWCDLTFVHWRIDPARVADRMPAGVRPDTADGSTWVGLVAFRIAGTAVGPGPPVPYLGSFAETNVRLYSVDAAGRHGIVFLSLDVPRLPVVLAGTLGLRLPYRWASMSLRREVSVDGAPARVSYRSRRRLPAVVDAGCRLDVEVGPEVADTGGLAVFLTARFGLHTSLRGRTVHVPTTHRPFRLHQARLTTLEDSLVEAAGLPGVADRAPDSVLFSPGVRSVFGGPRPAP